MSRLGVPRRPLASCGPAGPNIQGPGAMCCHTACGRSPEIVLGYWDPQMTQRSGSPSKSQEAAVGESRTNAAGPTVSDYLPRLEANATTRRIHLWCSKAAMATDEAGGWSEGHTLITRSRQRGVRDRRLACSSNSASFGEKPDLATSSGSLSST